MKNACMGRLGGLLRELNRAFVPLSSPRNCWRGAFGDLPLCKDLTRTNHRFPTTTLGNDGHDSHDNNRSWTTTFHDDGNNYYTASRGFTLIELLVVGLIIGILAAYALPSYRVAVGTSRAATMYALIRSVDQAQEHFYMQTGHYASNLDSLIVAMPAEFKKSDETTIYSADSRCWIMNTRGAENFSFNCSSKDNVRIEKYHKQSYYICWAPQTNDLANRICQNLSGLDTYNNASSDGTTSYAYQIK